MTWPTPPPTRRAQLARTAGKLAGAALLVTVLGACGCVGLVWTVVRKIEEAGA